MRPTSGQVGFAGVPRCDAPQVPSRLFVTPLTWPGTAPGRAAAVAVGTPACAAAHLRVHGGRQGGGFVGEALGTVVLSNTGPSTCVLSGIPAVALLAGGRLLGVTDVPPQNLATSAVALAPGAAGALTLDWSNFCGAAPGPLDVAVTPAGQQVAVIGPFDGPPNYDFVPACRDAARPSTLTVTDAYARA